MQKKSCSYTKLITFLVSLITTSFAFGQTTLYDQNGIKLTYTNKILKTAYCAEYGQNVYFVTARWQLYNYSGKPAYIQLGVNMQANKPAIGCVDDNIIHFTYQPGGSNVNGILKTGNSLSGEDGNWFLSSNVSPWYWMKEVKFTNIPAVGTVVKVIPSPKIPTSNKIIVAKKNNTTASVYQSDVVTNPKKQINYTKQQPITNVATANAVKGSQNSEKQGQNQLTAIKLTNSTTDNTNSSTQTTTNPKTNSPVTNQSQPKTDNQQHIADQINQNNAKIAQNNANTQQKNENIQNVTNSLTQAAGDIFSAIQEEKARKQQEWLDMTPEERERIEAENRERQRIKDSISTAKFEDDLKLGSAHPFSIGVYAGIESRTFTAENATIFNVVNGVKPLGAYPLKTDPSFGITFEWFVGNMANAICSTGIHYVSCSTPMIARALNTNAKDSVGSLKLSYIRIPFIINFRVIKFQRYSGIYFQLSVYGDYLFNAMLNPINVPTDLPVKYTYASVRNNHNISSEFNRFNVGMPLGIRVNLGRNFYAQLQYDVFGGLRDELHNSEDGFKQKDITLVGIGICL